MFTTGPGNASFTHTGAGTLSINSFGFGVNVQGALFTSNGLELPAAAGVSIGGLGLLSSWGVGDPARDWGIGPGYLTSLQSSTYHMPPPPVPCSFNCPINPALSNNYQVNQQVDLIQGLVAVGGGVAAGTNVTPVGGSFVFVDQARPDVPVGILPENSFFVRASGGISLGGFAVDDNPVTPGTVEGYWFGVSVDPGSSSWSTGSDVNIKTDWESADPESFLTGIANMHISGWRYKGERAGIRHVGPTSQDFRAAFGLGPNDTTISTVDADGASMLAIQALARRTDELKAATDRIAELEKRLTEIESLLREMKPRQ